MAFSQFGTESQARRKKVYYEGSDTIYEGMALCYNEDTLDNILGYDKGAGGDVGCQTTPGTTAEGNQNEGKFLRVEKPNSTNLLFFAGVVAGNSYGGLTGPRWIDIFIPNGAIVPVRSSISTTGGQSVLAIQAADYEFQTPTYDNGAESVPCALAMETVDRSTTEGICLAALYAPAVFSPQASGVTAGEDLLVGTGVSSGTVQAMRWMYESVQTGGDFSALRLRGEANGAGMNGALGLAMRAEGVVSAATGAGGLTDECDTCAVAAHLIFKTGAVPAAGIYASMFLKAENQDSTPADLAAIDLYNLVSAFQNNDANNRQAHMYFVNDGSIAVDALFDARDLAAIGAVASTGDAPALATGDIMIPVKIGANTYYLVALQDTGVA